MPTIREFRERRGLSQIDLARRARISISSLYRYEHGERQPRPKQLRAIANALGVTMGEINLPRTRTDR